MHEPFVVRVLLPVVVCAVLAAEPFAAGQVRDSTRAIQTPQPKRGTASISGTVLILSTSQPLADATVTLYGSPLPNRRATTTTDGEGRFAFTALAAARYVVGVAKAGFTNVTYGQRRYGAGGRSIPVRDGENLNIEVHVPPASAIIGTVVDERGTPSVKAQVRAFRSSMAFGYRRLMEARSATTDDRGVYRLHPLEPGEYTVCVSTRTTAPLNEAQRLRAEIDRQRRSIDFSNGEREDIRQAHAAHIAGLEAKLPAYVDPPFGYAPFCYPGGSSAATTIAVGPGEQRTGIDVQFALVRLARLDGAISGTRSEAREPDPVILMHSDGALKATIEHARPDHEGRFSFTNVPPGKYNLVLPGRAVGTSGPVRAWAMAEVVVAEQDVSNIVLHVRQGATLSGRVVFDGAPSPPPSTQSAMDVRADPVETADWARYALVTTHADSDGRFTLANLLPGYYRISAHVRGPTPWQMESAMLSGQNVFHQPLEVKADQTESGIVITLTNGTGELSGTILKEDGEPASEYLLFAYSAEAKDRTPRSRRMYTARASHDDGRYVFHMLPGTYRLAALLDVELGAWFDPAFFTSELDRQSVRVSVGEREKKVHNIRVPVQR